jgi:hypothetical protein
MNDTANTAAEERFEEDCRALRSYIETEDGLRDMTNAGILGRLVLHAHARLDDLALVMDRIANSLEKVVAPKLHDLQQLPEEVAELRETLPLYAALRQRVEIVEKDLQGGNLERLPEGVTRELGKRDVAASNDCTACGHAAESHGGLGSVCLIGSCDCLGYTYPPKGS